MQHPTLHVRRRLQLQSSHQAYMQRRRSTDLDRSLGAHVAKVSQSCGPCLTGELNFLAKSLSSAPHYLCSSLFLLDRQGHDTGCVRGGTACGAVSWRPEADGRCSRYRGGVVHCRGCGGLPKGNVNRDSRPGSGALFEELGGFFPGRRPSFGSVTCKARLRRTGKGRWISDSIPYSSHTPRLGRENRYLTLLRTT